MAIRKLLVRLALITLGYAVSATGAEAWFLQADPAGYKADIDLYRYVHNDPINETDPTGLAGCDSTLQGGDCDTVMSAQAQALSAVQQTRTALGNLQAERSEIKTGSRSELSSAAKSTEAAVQKAFGSSSNSVVSNVNTNLGKVEAFLADPGRANGGQYDYRTATASEVAAFPSADAVFSRNMPNTFGLNSSIYNNSGADNQVQAVIHDSLHVFGLGREELYRGDAIARAQSSGGTNWALNNPDNYACLVVPSPC